MPVEEFKTSKTCISCGIVILDKGFSHFSCPNCNEVIISRCRNCRDQCVNYVCPNCGFEGP